MVRESAAILAKKTKQDTNSRRGETDPTTCISVDLVRASFVRDTAKVNKKVPVDVATSRRSANLAMTH